MPCGEAGTCGQAKRNFPMNNESMLPGDNDVVRAKSTAHLLEALVDTFRLHMVISDHQAVALAAWSMHTFVFDRFQHTPRLAVLSPEKRCGKSTLLDLLGALCHAPVKVDSITPAALFRTVDAKRRLTLLVDEADSYLPGNDELRGMLNSGFEATGRVIRTALQTLMPIEFQTFCPVAIAAIGKLPGTVADRSIAVKLRRKMANEEICKVRRRRDAIGVLAQQILQWSADVDLADYCDPDIPESLNDRQADIAVPLLAIADEAGGEWPGKVRQALVSLFNAAEQTEDTDGQGAMLLADIRDIYAAAAGYRLSSSQICQRLTEKEGRPWADYSNGRPITPNQLAKLLAPFGIKPANIRLGEGVVKGYSKDDFGDAWQRYTPHPDVPF